MKIRPVVVSTLFTLSLLCGVCLPKPRLTLPAIASGSYPNGYGPTPTGTPQTP